MIEVAWLISALNIKVSKSPLKSNLYRQNRFKTLMEDFPADAK